MPWADGGSIWNATGCFPVDRDPDLPGEPCTVEGDAASGIDSCEEGSICWGVDLETNEGVCVAMCTGSWGDPMCPPGYSCATDALGVLILCLLGCDPLAQDCIGNEICIPVDGEWICAEDASGEMGAYGDPCKYANACDPGLACLNLAAVPDCMARECCSPFCNIFERNTCPGAGQLCIPWYDEADAPEEYQHVGVCAVPEP